MSERVAYQVNGREIDLVEGDITRQDVDAVVNAANSRLAGGGGVDGAIHRAAGPELPQACRRIGGCATGSAVITPGFQMTARYIIHAVGPVWQGGRDGEPDLLRSAYETSLSLAAEKGLATVALPALSTGVYGYPMEQAARVALETARGHLQGETSLREIRFVLFGASAFEVFRQAAEEVLGRT